MLKLRHRDQHTDHEHLAADGAPDGQRRRDPTEHDLAGDRGRTGAPPVTDRPADPGIAVIPDRDPSTVDPHAPTAAAPAVETTEAERPAATPVRERPAAVEPAPAPVRANRTHAPWGLGQLLALVVGIGMVVLGSMALARSGFDLDHIYSPHVQVGGLHATPLLGMMELVFGILVIVAASVPGTLRSILGLLGLASLGWGVLVLVWSGSGLHHRFGVHDANGWLYAGAGALLLLAAVLPATRERQVRRARRRS